MHDALGFGCCTVADLLWACANLQQKPHQEMVQSPQLHLQHQQAVAHHSRSSSSRATSRHRKATQPNTQLGTQQQQSTQNQTLPALLMHLMT